MTVHEDTRPNRLARWLVLLLLWSSPQCVWALTMTMTPVSSTTSCTSKTGVGTKAWSSPARAWADDNSYTTSSVDGTTSRYLQCLNYGFSIPISATIDGITVNVNRKSNRTDNGGARDAFMRIVKGGVIGTTDRVTSTLYTTTEVSEAHGGSGDLWGQAWTPADINAANFGAAFSATKASSAGTAHTVSVDVISITVSYTLDTKPPTVSSIVRASLNPASGTTVAWTVTFSEPVTGVDSADFSLSASGLIGSAITSVTGSGSTWTVTATAGNGTGTLGLNLVDNDSVIDAANNPLGGTGAGNGNRVGEVYTVDKTNPNVVSIARTGSNPTNAASLAWTVTFSESVTGVDATDFALASTGSATATITSVVGSGSIWTVTASSASGTGTLGLNLVDNDSILDVTSLPVGGAGAGNGDRAGEVYTLDRNSPTVLQINRADANPSTLNEVSWTVTFSESVSGVGVTDFSLATTGLAGSSITSVTGAGATWTVTADPGYGAGTLGLNLVDDDSIVDNLGNPLGGVGAGNGSAVGAVYTVTTPAMASYLMDEAFWNGTANQVADQQGGSPGTARNSATTAGVSAALSGSPGSCRYGTFQSAGAPAVTRGYIDLTSGFPYMTDSFTLAGWVRTTSNSTSNQWIFTHNTGGAGYSLSLGTAGTGRLRFLSAGASTANLDSPSSAASLLANDTWYFVAAVADFSAVPNIARRLYVFNTAGGLLSGYPVSVTATGWGDTEAGAASIGGDGSNSFRGNLDEFQVFDKPLSQAAVTALAQARHACATSVPDHYELSLPGSSISCLPSTVTVTACADTSSPCTNPYTLASGTSVTLGASAGSLAATSLTFDASGVATTTLSHPAAANGAVVSVTMSGESISATSARQCCPTGSTCSAAASCSSTFSTAGFIMASSTTGAAATLPAQTAGTASAGYFLRAVKTSTTTGACTSALPAGVNTVDWAVQCNNPTTCAATTLMSVTGSSAKAISGNPNTGVTAFTSVPMSFDASGNAPFSFNYADVGQVTLHASKAASGALLSTLTGSSNAFVVKPAGFLVSTVKQTASPFLANPAAASAAGAKFVKAGESFSATVTATTSGGVAAPNFGRETVPEGVLLTPTLVLPAGGAAGALSGGTVAGGSFSSGVATATALSFSEVGIITLAPSLADGDYLGAGSVSGTASGNIGRFVPAQFALSSATFTQRSTLSCSPAASFSYLGENFRTAFTLTAQGSAGATTANYTGSFAKLDPTSAAAWNLAGVAGSTVFSAASGRLALGSATGSWSNGVASGVTITANATRAATPDGPFSAVFGIAPVDTDGVALAGYDIDTDSAVAGNDRAAVGKAALRFGRLRLGSAIGAADRALSMPVAAQHWDGSAFVTNTLDSCTTLPATALSFGNLRRTLTVADTSAAGTVTLAAGLGTLKLAAPLGGRSGTFDVAVSLGSGGTDASCLQPWTPGSGDAATAGASLAYLRGAWCSTAYDKDPAARATFGQQRGNDALVYRRENY